MSEERPGQFGVDLYDGMRIDRLPIGWGAEHWWINFVLSGAGLRAGKPPLSQRLWNEIPELLRLDDDAGRITLPPTASGDGGFGGDVYWIHYQLTDDLRRLTVSYLDDGEAIASENLDLA